VISGDAKYEDDAFVEGPEPNNVEVGLSKVDRQGLSALIA
jgi:hypothetical protein